jgi:hypothetical protein
MAPPLLLWNLWGGRVSSGDPAPAGSPSFKFLVFPSRIAQRSAIQLRLAKPPRWHEAVHQFGEPVVMMAFQPMRHLMDDDVLQALAPASSPIPDSARCGALRRCRHPIWFSSASRPTPPPARPWRLPNGRSTTEVRVADLVSSY